MQTVLYLVSQKCLPEWCRDFGIHPNIFRYTRHTSQIFHPDFLFCKGEKNETQVKFL